MAWLGWAGQGKTLRGLSFQRVADSLSPVPGGNTNRRGGDRSGQERRCTEGQGAARHCKARSWITQPIADWKQSAFGWKHHAAWPGLARMGVAGKGLARQGKARQGKDFKEHLCKKRE